MDSFIYYLVYDTNSNNRILLMDKITKKTRFWMCNCVHGHQNCKCDGKTGKKVRK
jgi:hypothetical protein